MSAPKEPQSYQIMSRSDVTDMYKKALKQAKDKAELTYEIHKSKIYQPHNKEKTVSLLKRIIILSERYNLNETEYLYKIINSSTEKEAEQIVIDLKAKAIETYKNFSALEEIGRIRRTLYGIQFPAIFGNQERIYLKTKPILSETELMQDIIDYLNYPLLKTEKFSFSIETKTIEEGSKFNKKEKKIKRIWLKQKQDMKPVAKLRQYELECTHLLKMLQENEELKHIFFRFITKIPNNQNLGLYFSKFKQRKNFPPFRLDPILLRHLKSYRLKEEAHLMSILQNIAQKLQFFHLNLHEMLIKPLSDSENDTGIDTIILSTLPRDISSMSTFVHWESCMTNGGLYFQDVMMQIGTGSIIAYGINSQNPQKKLARILLKPFETAKTLRQRINYLEHIDAEFNFPNISLSKTLLYDYEDMNKTKRKFLEEETDYLDDEELKLNPKQVERIYKIDKIYGLQNQAFKEILESFIANHLNTNTVPGTYMIVDSMYLDSLHQSYQIYDRFDKDNLIKYLIYNKIPYHFDTNGVIHTAHLNITDIPNLHLRPLNLKTLTLNANMLDQETKSLTVERLFIEQASTLKRKTFPQTIHITNGLFFENSDKQFDMPFGLGAPIVSASHTKLTSVAPDIQTEELILSDSSVSFIPPIKVATLDISDCKKIKKLPNEISISQKLNASKSALQYIPPLKTYSININGTKNLTALPIGIQFNQLSAIHSSLTLIPKNLSGISLNASFSNITEIPEGTVFQEVILDSTPLNSIHPEIQIKSLSINNTPIKAIPNGLKFYKLSAENCQNLTKLPNDIIVEGTLNLSNSNIKEVPVLKTQNIHLTRCKNFEYLPKETKFQNLFAAQSGLKNLPEEISANIILCPQSKLQSIPSFLKAISLDARHTPLETIGDHIVIDTLNISHTPIATINPNIKIQNLEAVHCQNLTEFTLMPQKTKKINLMGSAVQSIHNIDTGLLNISNCQKIATLDNSVTFRDLIAENASLSSLPENLCATTITLSNCPIKKLPNNMIVHKLVADNTPIQELPATICADELNINNTKITVIPADIQVKRLSMENLNIQTLYYSPHFEEIIVNNPIKYIHPSIPNECFIGLTLSQIKQGKHNFKQKNKSQRLKKQQKQSQYE